MSERTYSEAAPARLAVGLSDPGLADSRHQPVAIKDEASAVRSRPRQRS